MNKNQKIHFLKDLIGNVTKEILDDIDKIPDNWDGHELREYVKDRFSLVSFNILDGKRKKNYKNDLLVNNL